MRFSIRKILGFRPAEAAPDVVLGLATPDGDVELSLNPDMLTALALEALGARSTWELSQAPNANCDFHALVVERWEIRRSAQKNGMLLSFKTKNGAWLRFEIPRDAIAAMNETIEVAEGRRFVSTVTDRIN